MDARFSGRKIGQITEAKLSELTPGIRAFVIVRIARLWKTVLPPDNEFTSLDFVAVDDEQNAMHGMIPLDYVESFEDQLEEGRVYKIKLFQITKRKHSHNAVPSEAMFCFNSSTQIQEIHNSIDKYPRYYFNFATMENILAKSDNDPFMTDVIGILISFTPVTSVNISPRQKSANITDQISSKQIIADKRDIYIKFLSGDKLRISIWENILVQLNIDHLFEQPTKPVIAIAGTTIKSYGAKYLSTSSATKIYIDPEIPETAALKERYQNEASGIEMMLPTETITTQTQIEEIKIEDLHYLNAKEIKGKKFHVRGKITKINMRRGWFYRSCSKCTFRADSVGQAFICSQHGATTPRLIMRLNLIIEDDTAKLDVTVFGALAEKLTKYELTSSAISEGVQHDQLPDEIKRIINEDYIFTVGLSDQTSDQFMVRYKILGFTLASDPSIAQPATTSAVHSTKYQSIVEPVSPVSQEIPADIFPDESPAKKPKTSDVKRTLHM